MGPGEIEHFANNEPSLCRFTQTLPQNVSTPRTTVYLVRRTERRCLTSTGSSSLQPFSSIFRY